MTWMSNTKEVHSKPRLHVSTCYLEYGRHVARLRRRRRLRTRPRAIPLAIITMGKSTHGFPFVSHIWVAYGAPLGGHSGRRSSATKFTQLKDDLSQNNGLLFIGFLMYNFPLSRCFDISSFGENTCIIRFLLFEFVLLVFFAEDFGMRIDEILLKRNSFNMLLLFLRRLRSRSE